MSDVDVPPTAGSAPGAIARCDIPRVASGDDVPGTKPCPLRTCPAAQRGGPRRGTRRPTAISSAPSHAASRSSASRIAAPAAAAAPGSAQTPMTDRRAVASVEDGLDAADQLGAAEDRQDVVAVLALRLRHEHLEPVVEAEQRLRAVAIVDQAVERGEERDAVGHRRRRARPDAPPSHRARAARRARGSGRSVDRRSASRSGSASVSGSTRSARSQRRCPPRRPAIATSPRRWSDVSMSPTLREPYQRRSSFAPERAVLELAREQRAAPLELPQDVAAEGAVLGEEVADPALGLVVRRASPAPHAGPARAELLDRPDERVPLEERALVPAAGGRAPRRRTPPSRLQRTRCCAGATLAIGSSCRKPSRRTVVEHVRRGPVEELRPDGDPPRLRLVDERRPGRRATPAAEPAGLRHGGPLAHCGELDHRRTLSRPMMRRSRSRARSNASSSAPEARTPSSRWNARTTSSPVARSDLRSARPTMRSRQRKGRT